MKGCKHNNAWVMNCTFLWCPDCGSIRRLNLLHNKFEWSRWLRPIGKKTYSLYKKITEK